MENFFTKDKNFYRTFFQLMLVVALQNLVAYSVNMLDNMMLGSYSQNALSGAATVNQIFFMVNQLALAIGNALIVMSSQYWGKRDTYTIKKLTGIALTFSVAAAVIVVLVCAVWPEQLLRIFTTSPDIITEGMTYLGILKWTFALFLISNLLISMLRSVETVQISIGIILAMILLVLRKPLLSTYNLTAEATVLADHLMIIMSAVMVGMSYQMPVSVGVIQGGGDTKFNMYMNLISTWGIVMPLSFLAAFVWKLPVEWVVVAVQSDQFFKCMPVFLRFRSYKWIRKLA